MDIRFELPEINTWRLFNKSVTQRGVVEMVQAWEAHGYRFGCVCIDDGWTVDGRLGDWTPDPARFPDLRELVDWIHARGYAVRLWIAPSQCHPGTAICDRALPDAMLRDPQGGPSFFAGLGTYRLDPRHPVAQAHIRQTMQRLVRDYDVDAFKVDFPPFLEPHDASYKLWRITLDDAAASTMVPDFYRLVRRSVDEVRQGVRICCAKDIANCQPYIDDTICGDFIGGQRTDEMIAGHARKVRDYVKGHAITPWLEMVWGGGGDSPINNRDWHTGYLEFMAHSINHGLKLEHSFWPFDFPNARQVRALSNLYGPRNPRCKVLGAGRKLMSLHTLLQQDVAMDHRTRFLVAMEEDTRVTLHVGELGTSALQWHGRDVLGDRPIRLIARNEYWSGNLKTIRMHFDAQAGQVYELWHEGQPVDYYRQLFTSHVRPWQEAQPGAAEV